MSKKFKECEAYRKVRKSILLKRREYKKRSASMCRPVIANFFFGSPTKKQFQEDQEELASPQFIGRKSDKNDEDQMDQNEQVKHHN